MDMISLMVFPSCPIKLTTITKIGEFVTRYSAESGEQIYCPMLQDMSTRELAAEIGAGTVAPDIIVQAGYGSLFSPDFISLARKVGYTDAEGADGGFNATFKDLALKDPESRCRLLGGSFSIIVVNKNRMGGRKIPRSMYDLLKEEYAGMVTLHGHNNTTCDRGVLLDIYTKYGDDGIEKFKRSLKFLKHFSWTVKNIGSGTNGITPLAVVPEMFADFLSRDKRLEVIWPEDGSPLFPLFMTVKKAGYEKASEVVDFLTGPEMGQTWSDAFFASTNSGVTNKDYTGRALNWPGWELINRNSFSWLLDSLELEVVTDVNTRQGIAFKADRCKSVC